MYSWRKETDKDKTIKYILFFINPIIGLLCSFNKMNTKSSYNILFLFCLVFGLSFTVESSFWTDVAGYLDGMHHRADFERYLRFKSWDDLKTIFYNTFIGAGEKDYYAPLMKFLVSRVTNNYHVFFLVISFVFTYFSLNSFKYFLFEIGNKNSFSIYMLAYLFLSIQIFQINGVRFFTAAWVAIYALFKILVDKQNKFLLLLLITPLIHRAFFFLLVVCVIFFFLNRFQKLWIVLYFISFFLSEVVINFLSQYLNLLSDNYLVWANMYIERTYNFGDGGYFFDLFAFFVRTFRNLLIILLISNSKEVIKNRQVKGLFVFVLVLVTFTNLTMPISNLGSRFSMLLYPLIAYIWIVVMRNKYVWVWYILPFVYFYKAFYYDPIFLYSCVLEPCFFYSSPIYLIYKYLILPI